MVAVAESEWDMGKIDTSAKHERGFVWRPDAVVLKSVKAERERLGWGALSRGELWSSVTFVFLKFGVFTRARASINDVYWVDRYISSLH